ncbi:SLC13/DASS family transporter [bacterium]|nr:SLC13/DASS family transporter [bacterium]
MMWRNPRRLVPFLLGALLFAVFAAAPPFPVVSDPAGEVVTLTREGQAALGLFLLAGIWWVFEVVPVGVTAIAIAVFQSLLVMRDPRAAMTDFMDPTVWFIFGSLLIGAAFSRTGLTRRLAYRMMSHLPERVNVIYLGVFAMTAFLTLFMAHTAVAAAVFPLLLVIHNLYEPSGRPTRFGKGLFIGMAWTAGAGSIITLLGAARGAVALGFYHKLGHDEIGFFELSRFMAPLGVAMVLVLWGYICVAFRPERDTVPGLRAKAQRMAANMGPLSRRELATIGIVIAVVAVLSLRSFVPALAGLDKSALILAAGLLFFLSGILELKDLESMPWNIVLLFGGAMSIGFCLWQTGAAEWMAIGWLNRLHGAPWFLFIMGVAFFVMIMTNFIMNVAAIAITLPVALVMAGYLGVHPEVIVFASLAAAGMPFMLLVGAAPNAIAFESKMFRTRDFFLHGIPASALLMIMIALFVWKVWPLMGMPIHTG